MGDELVFRHDAMTLLNQVGEHIKDLGFELDRLTAAPQFMALQVERIVFIEGIDYGGASACRPQWDHGEGLCQPIQEVSILPQVCGAKSLTEPCEGVARELLGRLARTLPTPQPAQAHSHPQLLPFGQLAASCIERTMETHLGGEAHVSCRPAGTATILLATGRVLPHYAVPRGLESSPGRRRARAIPLRPPRLLSTPWPTARPKKSVAPRPRRMVGGQSLRHAGLAYSTPSPAGSRAPGHERGEAVLMTECNHCL
jgi:hypothetical protein